jgi:tetratricopeptide (TPR) repeat protein
MQLSKPVQSLIFIGVVILAFGAIIVSTPGQSDDHAGGFAQPVTSVWYGPPNEILEIRQLLQRGATEDAVQMGINLVDRLQISSVGTRASSSLRLYRYRALNALCVAFAADRQLGEALATCEQAIGLMPERWEAYNSRGTVFFKGANFESALRDFSLALEQGAPTPDLLALIQHNVELAQSRLAGG